MCPDCSPPSAKPSPHIRAVTLWSPISVRTSEMPDFFSAASAPRLVWRVPTTEDRGRRPRPSRARASTYRILSPSTTRPFSSHAMTRSASPSNESPRSAPRRTVSAAASSGCSAPHPRLMLSPSSRANTVVTAAPHRENISGASRPAAPLAQSSTTCSPSSRPVLRHTAST